jgi:hypothetical protein
MPKGILYVESHPDPEQIEAFHHWYNDVHLKEMISLDGFVAARRFEPLNGVGPFVAIYEIETDDLDAVPARLAEFGKSGGMSAPVGVRTDVTPVIRFYRDISPA